MKRSVWSMRTRALVCVATLAACSVLAACGGDDEEVAAAAPPPAAGPPPPAPPPPAPPANRAPTISGTPGVSVTQGIQYSFTPTASDADGDSLTFSIQGRPAWAQFTTTTGLLRGTPGPTDVGMHTNIRITVSDGTASADLAAFNVLVLGTATGSVTLTWTPPTQNTDGSPLGADLRGYKVYWGTSQGNYPNSVTLNNPGLTSYFLDQLTPATWYFVTTAYNAQNVESAYSNIASKTIN